MRVTKCDICGKEIKGSDFGYVLTLGHKSMNPFKQYLDLHKECYGALIESARSMVEKSETDK